MSFVNNFSNGYQVPGAYVQQVLTATATISPITTPVVAIVGPTRGYLTATDGLALSVSVPTALSNTGVNTSTIQIVSAQGVVYQNTDFTYATTGTGYTATTTIELTNNSNIPPGVVVYITYQYTNSNYYYPQTFTGLQAVLNAYGQPVNSSNVITSPVSLAAAFAFGNGASQVMIMPTTDSNLTATRTGLSSAYTTLSTQTFGLVVPLPVGMTGTTGTVGDILNVASDLGTFATSSASAGNLFTGYVGYETSVTVSPTTISATALNQRVINCWPYSLSFSNQVSNQSMNIGGYYLAAAIAGYLASQPSQTPLTKKVITGFNGIPNSIFQTMTTTYKNSLSAGGVTVLEPNPNGALWIRDGVTTLGTSVMTQEISLVRAADTMIQTISNTLNTSGLIGTATTANSPTQVTGLVTGVLNELVSAGTIIAYQNVTAAVTGVNPTVITVTFSYSPSYPLNYIVVSFTVNTATGTIAPTTATS